MEAYPKSIHLGEEGGEEKEGEMTIPPHWGLPPPWPRRNDYPTHWNGCNGRGCIGGMFSEQGLQAIYFICDFFLKKNISIKKFLFNFYGRKGLCTSHADGGVTLFDLQAPLPSSRYTGQLTWLGGQAVVHCIGLRSCSLSFFMSF